MCERSASATSAQRRSGSGKLLALNTLKRVVKKRASITATHRPNSRRLNFQYPGDGSLRTNRVSREDPLTNALFHATFFSMISVWYGNQGLTVEGLRETKMKSEHVTIEINDLEILLSFYTPSTERFLFLRWACRKKFPEAKGDITRRCQVIPKSPGNIKAVIDFCHVHFSDDRVFVFIAPSTAA
jgi:hypothetical protein